jgi:dipeptidyl aminopeptidase/acylaminoacyl peptidase
MCRPLRSIVRATCACGAALLAACGPKAAPPPPAPAAAGPALVLYYADGAGVHRLDARSGTDSLYFRAGRSRLTSALSPDHAKLALGLDAPDGARLVIVDAATGAVSTVHTAGRGYTYTLAWSPQGDRLAFGYSAGAGRGDVLVTTPGGKPQPVGCGASKLVFGWTSADTIVVGDGRDLFPVDVQGCRGKGVIYGAGKRDITFSPDGKRLFYYGSARARRGARSVQANDLFVATSDGVGGRRVVGPEYDPRDAEWSPDGSRLVLDVQSPDTASLRYIALYDVGQQRLRFFPSHTPDGVPRDTDPHWAPDGTQVVHQRAVGQEHDLILRTLAQDPTAVHVEPTVLLSGPSVGSVWGWVDDTRMVVVSDQETRILTKDGTVAYTRPGVRDVLAVVPAR